MNDEPARVAVEMFREVLARPRDQMSDKAWGFVLSAAFAIYAITMVSMIMVPGMAETLEGILR